MFYVVLFVLLLVYSFVSQKKKRRKARDRRSAYNLNRWEDSESRDIKRPRDPRTKFCVANIGTAITIKYNGGRRTITPVRVFTKPSFHKTYVLAKDNGEFKTFDIDDMALIPARKR